MKISLIILAVLFTTLTQAQVHEAKSFDALIDRVENATFTYKETGKIFGYVSTQSCLFVADDIVIFKNYCFPVRKYPARGYTIITKESGVIDLYEETYPGLILRDIRIDTFPVYLRPYMGDALPTYTLSDLSGIIAELYPRYFPGCWSTNFSRYTEAPEANCNVPLDSVVNGMSWASETQSIVNDEAAWFRLMDAIEAKLKR